jgi:uncharacterized protein (TIGR00725 family)
MPTAALFGSSLARPDDPACRLAAELAAGLARRGFTLKNGGYGGVMEAASRAAREAGGPGIGVTLAADGSARPPHPHLTREIREADLLARLRTLVEDTDIFFAVEGGGPGTLNELFLVWSMRLLGEIPGRPIVLVGPGWQPVLDSLRPHLVLRDGAWGMLTLAPDAGSALAAAAALTPGTTPPGS